MFRGDREKVIGVCYELQQVLQKTYKDMGSSNERALGIYRGETIGYKFAISKLIEEFGITREELSKYKRKIEGESELRELRN